MTSSSVISHFECEQPARTGDSCGGDWTRYFKLDTAAAGDRGRFA